MDKELPTKPLDEEEASFRFREKDDQSGQLTVNIDDIQLFDQRATPPRLASTASLVLALDVHRIRKSNDLAVEFNINTNKSSIELSDTYALSRVIMVKESKRDIFFRDIQLTFQVRGDDGIQEVMREFNAPIRLAPPDDDDDPNAFLPIDITIAFDDIKKQRVR